MLGFLEATTPTIDWSSFDFNIVVTYFMGGVTAVMGAVIVFIGIRKALNYMLGQMKRV